METIIDQIYEHFNQVCIFFFNVSDTIHIYD